MPWILVPNPATLSVQPVSGLRFLSDNILMLIFLSLIIFTYAFSLKVKSIRILILLLNCNIKCIKNFKNLYRQRITQ